MLIRTGYNRRDDNLGDQLIMLSLAHALRPYGKLVLGRAMPPFLAPLYDASGVRRARLLAAIERLRGGRVFRFLPPGGKVVGDPYLLRQQEQPSKFGRWLDGRVVHVGFSVSPGMDVSAWRNADWVGVRDQVSLDMMQGAGITKLGYFPDLCFLYPAEPTPSQPRDRLAMTFRPSILRAKLEETDVQQPFERCLRELVRDQRCAGLRPLWVHQVAEDAELSRRLCSILGGEVLDEPLTLDSFSGVYARCEAVVSNRLHALLMGALHGAIPIGLTTRDHHKIRSLFETVGLSDLLVDVEAEDAPQRVRDLIGRAADLRQRVRDTFAVQRELGETSLRELLLGETSAQK